MFSLLLCILTFVLIYYFSKNIYVSIVSAIIVFYLTISLTKPTSNIENMTSGRKRKRKKKRSRKKNKDKKKYKIDSQKSLFDNYQKLTPDQVNGLNNDTKSLIQTQKDLMNTLKEMGPVLSQGKSIIGAFDKFFGKNTDAKLPHHGADEPDINYLTKLLSKKKKKIVT